MKKAISAATSAALLASLLATAVAPAAFASTAVVSAGTIARGTTSTGSATFTFTENSVNAFPAGGTLVVTILDSAGGNTVHFSGTPVVAAPQSLGTVTATIGGGALDNVLTITTTNQDPNTVEQISVSGLKIYADLFAFDGDTAATGAIGAVLTGTMASAVLAATTTATGVLQASLGAAAATVSVNVTSACGFDATAAGLANFSDISDARAITADATRGTGLVSIGFAAGASTHNIGATVTQTVPNCTADLASPGTVADAVVETTLGKTGVVPGEQNQAAGSLTITEQTAAYVAVGTLTFTLSPAGVLFSSSPVVTSTGDIAVGSSCNLSSDRKSCAVSVTAASTTPSSVTLGAVSGITLDVASTVAAGSKVTVAVTASPAINVAIDDDVIATVGRVIVGVAAQPTIFINFNDQATGLITLTEQGAGFFKAGSGSNNTFGLCLFTGETFTRAPYAVVTAGDLKLLSGLVGGTSVLGTLYTLGSGTTAQSCAYWTVYSASTAASTIEIRGSDTAGAVLPTGSLNGPRLSVRPGLAPGTTQADILVGLHDDVLDISDCGTDCAFSSVVSFATRAFKSGVVVAAVSQPTIPAGSVDSLAGNLTISETLNGQFKPGQDICVTILPRTSNGARTQDTFLKTATTNDLPVITTNAASGLLTSALGTPGCASAFRVNDGSGIGFAPNQGASFTFTVSQQSFGGALGVITISNIHMITTADAVNGTVLVDVIGDNDGGAVAFESVVSNAKIGARAAIRISAVSALGLRPNQGPWSVSTKVAAAKKFITWRFAGGSALAGKTVRIYVATKNSSGGWGPFVNLTARVADASGNAYFQWRSTGKWISARAFYVGDTAFAPSWSTPRQGRWL